MADKDQTAIQAVTADHDNPSPHMSKQNASVTVTTAEEEPQPSGSGSGDGGEEGQTPAAGDQVDEQKKGFLAYFKTKEFYITLLLG